jgi:hypothetical protein
MSKAASLSFVWLEIHRSDRFAHLGSEASRHQWGLTRYRAPPKSRRISGPDDYGSQPCTRPSSLAHHATNHRGRRHNGQESEGQEGDESEGQDQSEVAPRQIGCEEASEEDCSQGEEKGCRPEAGSTKTEGEGQAQGEAAARPRQEEGRAPEG